MTGHETLIAGLTLPDAGDLRVLAAVIRCNANVKELNQQYRYSGLCCSGSAPHRPLLGAAKKSNNFNVA